MYVKSIHAYALIVLCIKFYHGWYSFCSYNLSVLFLMFYIALIFLLSLAFLASVYFMYAQRRSLKFMQDTLLDATDSSMMGFLVFGDDEHLIYANLRARELVPILLLKQEMKLSSILDFFFDHAIETDEILEKTLSRSLLYEPNNQFREIIRNDNGDLCLVEMQKTSSGRTVAIVKEVSHLTRQEEQVYLLNRANKDLYQAIEVANSAVVLFDPKGADCAVDFEVVFANSACCDMVHLAKSDIVSCRVGDFFRKLEQHEYQKHILKAMERGEAYQKEVKLHLAGKTEWYDLRLTPVMGDQGRLDLFILVFADTTALRTREEEFFKAQKLEALGRLSAGVAHDFNNILSIIEGYSQMIKSNLDDKGKIVDFADKLRNAAQRGASLTRQMLAFSRHKVVKDDVMDVSRVLWDQETLVRPLLGQSVDLVIRAGVDDLRAKCSEDSIAQIVLNLCINACDAMPEGGVITIGLDVCEEDDLPDVLLKEDGGGDYLLLSVSDTGTGMDPDVLEHIFEPFFTTKEQGKGTGLGLSVVYGMVQQIGGHIEVASELFQGTTFYIYIPRSYEAASRQILGTVDDVDSIELTGYKILVAEDEDDLRQIVCENLRQKGLEVFAASNGEEALDILDDQIDGIDILLTDIVMPGIDGVKLADLARSLLLDLKVIYMSGYPAKGEVIADGMPDDAYFIAKPLDYAVLCKLIFISLTGQEDVDEEFLKMTAAYWKTDHSVSERNV